MDNRLHHITQLILKDLAGKLTGSRKRKLKAWLDESGKNWALYDKWKDDDAFLEELKFYNDIITGRIDS